ncbi:MAG: TetR/AcrR family transcriptional regulator [Lachnospiraceae bacterium]|nr:TetR/AcrR family transcriptional regulator [Lachnospiraceae bacterium]MDE7273883.1 TetR/AcrR family transcriptional regulator [Lachnospiraceae bacterium]
MPKQRITKEMVVDAAFAIARSSGMEQVLVKNIADRLGCSVQPIYSYCKNMEGLRQDVTEQVSRFIQEYIAARIDQKDLFRSTGNAYLQLAKEEPNLFKIFILRQRSGISALRDLYRSEAGADVADFIAEQLHIQVSQARQLHLHMLIYTIGLGTIFSVTTPGISADEILEQQENAYKAFLGQMLEEKDCEAE